jgi:hypothetical protein
VAYSGCRFCGGSGCLACESERSRHQLARQAVAAPRVSVVPAVSREIKMLGGEGTLVEADLPSLGAAAERVLALLADHQWHSATEVIQASQQREGLRRLRQLRQAGHRIEARRSDDLSREWVYRLEVSNG